MMKFIKRLLGISETHLPADPGSWSCTIESVQINLSRMPELGNPGTGVRLEGKGLDPRVLLIHGDDGQYHAFANRCTHMGRRIDTIAGSNTIECCSVSKSTFSYDGQPVGGAAKKPITPFSVTVEGDRLTITLA
jgi:nitrite reductase/ring-hydroxylating ferredoxin subunit